jgi:hypothetical protein
MLIEIKSWRDWKVLYSVEADLLLKAVELAVTNGASLNYASLDGAMLDGASLDGASLNYAMLDGASLKGASLSGASLDGASLNYARLDGASLNYARLNGASLKGAMLDGANLDRASLDYAILNRASLDYATRLQAGETWEEYLLEVVPALLQAGGKSLDSFKNHWDCHSWDNCPMAHAFDVHSEAEAPILLWPRVRQFVQLFDAKLIPGSVLDEKDPSAHLGAREL